MTATATAARSALTPSEIETYRRDGLVKPSRRLTEAQFAALHDGMERLLRARPEMTPDFLPLPHIPWADMAEAREIAKVFFDAATSPALLDLVEAVIGPDIVFWTSALFCKRAGVGARVPWHQDGEYWPIRPPATVTMWIALDRVDRGNGAMQWVPGSHRLGYFKHKNVANPKFALDNEIDDPRFDPAQARYNELEPGELSLHDVLLVHGSEPNTSSRRRAGITFRYMPSASHFDRAMNVTNASSIVPVEFTQRPIWLVRGVDRCGKNDFTTGHWWE
ncbi:MAG: phytanoyl-CoA dioxygenase family protein [Alphaproteobacteria bacterium]